MKDGRDLGCAVFVVGFHSTIRRFVKLLVPYSIVPFQSKEETQSKDFWLGYGYSIWEMLNLGGWLKVNSSWVKLINFGIGKWQLPAFASGPFSLAFECAITCSGVYSWFSNLSLLTISPGKPLLHKVRVDTAYYFLASRTEFGFQLGCGHL